MNWKTWAWLFALSPFSNACASLAGDSDSETHFACAADEDCRAKLGGGFKCAENVCKKSLQQAGVFAQQEAGAASLPEAGSGQDAKPTDSRTPTLAPDADGTACMQYRQMPELLGQNVYVVLDGSTGMADPIPGSSGTWWASVTNGIGAFASSSVPLAVHMGIQVFPAAGTLDPCLAAYDVPLMPFLELPASAVTYTAPLGARTLTGQASPGPAVKAAIGYLEKNSAERPYEQYKVLLVTNRVPDACDPTSASGLAALAAAGKGASPSVLTYILALGGVSAFYDEVAAAGGTNRAIAISGGDVTRQVTDAFESIFGLGQTVSCDVGLDRFQVAGKLDLSLFDVSFDLVDGASSYVTRVERSDDCAMLERDGWYFDDPSAPTKIVLCQDLCAHRRSHGLSVTYGCRR